MAGSRLKAMLEKCVRTEKNPFMTYGEFAKVFSLGSYAPAWANRKMLDDAARECRADTNLNTLDLTFILRNRETNYPSVIGGRPFDKNDPGPQMKMARHEAAEIINYFSLNARNPY